jgi:hypothetical protein
MDIQRATLMDFASSSAIASRVMTAVEASGMRGLPTNLPLTNCLRDFR